MNDTLMQQCRREAEERYPCAIPGIIDDYERRRWIKLWAECLYAERSKCPPTVEGPSMITMEEAIAVLKPWIAKNSEDGEVLWHVLPEEKAEGITKYEADLRERLTAAANNNTNDNG